VATKTKLRPAEKHDKAAKRARKARNAEPVGSEPTEDPGSTEVDSHAPPESPRFVDFCRLSAVLDEVTEALERGE
jgi:hypothetical protein